MSFNEHRALSENPVRTLRRTLILAEGVGEDGRVTLFGRVACEYDAARPAYPDALFDALGPVVNLRVLDVGAGTGLATRPFLQRGALVVAIEPEANLLARAVEHTPTLAAVIADGTRLPLRDRCVDLVCFAQSWHWLHPDTRTGEVARVLHPGGRWAGWWSHARADGHTEPPTSSFGHRVSLPPRDSPR